MRPAAGRVSQAFRKGNPGGASQCPAQTLSPRGAESDLPLLERNGELVPFAINQHHGQREQTGVS